jgi:hypothetical protein
VLSGLSFLPDLVTGVYCYRKDSQRPVSYLFWRASVLTPLLLIIAVIVMV